jgi:hypothetical protein
MKKLLLTLTLASILLLVGCSGDDSLLLLKNPEKTSPESTPLALPTESADGEQPPQLPDDDLGELPALPDDDFDGPPQLFN